MPSCLEKIISTRQWAFRFLLVQVETGQMSAVEAGQMSAVLKSSGFAWACGVFAGAPRRGLLGEESEEGGSVSIPLRTPSLFGLTFRCFGVV